MFATDKPTFSAPKLPESLKELIGSYKYVKPTNRVFQLVAATGAAATKAPEAFITGKRLAAAGSLHSDAALYSELQE